MTTILILKNNRIAAYYPLGDLEKIIKTHPDDEIAQTSQPLLPPKMNIGGEVFFGDIIGMEDPRTDQEKEDDWKLQQQINAIKANWQMANNSELDELRIFAYIPRTQNPNFVDYSLLGLKKGVTKYSRGRITQKSFLDSEGKVVVDRTFEDITGETFQIKSTSRWYDKNDTVKLTKDDFKEYGDQEKEKLFRDRRARQVSVLIASGKGTAAEALFSDIFSTYSKEISEFVEVGTESLKDSMEGEIDPLMLMKLNQSVPDLWNPGQTISIREGILRELYA